MRWIVLVAVLAVSAAESLASDIGDGSLILLGDGPTFEQLLSGTSGAPGAGLNHSRPSLNNVDSVLFGSRAAPKAALTDEAQLSPVQQRMEDRQAEAARPELEQNQPTPNSTIVHASAGEVAMDDLTNGVASKVDLAFTGGLKSSLGLEDAALLGQNGKSDLTLSPIRPETLGVAAVVLLSLWLVLTAIVVLVHAEQRADQRRGLATLQRLVRRNSISAAKLVPSTEHAQEAQHDEFLPLQSGMKPQTANSNIEQGAVHAA